MSLYCYLVGIGLFLVTPFADCSEKGRPSEYTFSIKGWIIIYMVISIVQIYRNPLNKRINDLYMANHITYRTRQRLRTLTAFSLEGIHLGWQIYGNFIYYEWRGATDEDNSDFEACMDLKNNGWEFSMLLLLIIGYCFMLVYALIFVLLCVVLYNRLRSR